MAKFNCFVFSAIPSLNRDGVLSSHRSVTVGCEHCPPPTVHFLLYLFMSFSTGIDVLQSSSNGFFLYQLLYQSSINVAKETEDFENNVFQPYQWFLMFNLHKLLPSCFNSTVKLQFMFDVTVTSFCTDTCWQDTVR